jgi:hypothetical protein
MPLAEALQYDQIFWQQFDQQRQMHAFDRVAKIYVRPAFDSSESNELV